MPNVFKYAPGATAPGTLKKGDFLIGNNTADYGGTYYTGITPVTGGYTIYQNKPTGGPAINYALNEAEMIQYTFLISNLSFATGPSALNWYNSQTDKVVVDRDYEPIVTSGLTVNLDPGYAPSYPKGGTSIFNNSTNTLTYTLLNGVGYSSLGGGSLQFDGVDDRVTSNTNYTMVSGMTWDAWCNRSSAGNFFNMVVSNPLPYIAFRGPGDSFALDKFQGSWYTVNSGVNTQRNIYSPLRYRNNAWYNCTFTLQNDIPNQTSVGKLYVNGALVISSTWPTESTYQPMVGERVVVGNYRTSDPYPFPGNISRVGIYEKALSDSEVLRNYQAMLPRFVGENIVTSGMTLYLDAGYSTSYGGTGTTWSNVGGASGGNAVLTNGPTYTSSNGGGIVFDGVDDYAIISNASGLINTTTSGTVDFFYKLNSVPDSDYEDVWGIRTPSSGRIFLYENNEITNPSPIMRLVWRFSDSSLESISSGIPYDSLLVYNITFTYVVSGGSTTVALYKNGSLVQSRTSNKVLDNPANEIRLGTDFNQYSNCTIFTYRIYNRVLSAAEILQNFNAQRNRFGI